MGLCFEKTRAPIPSLYHYNIHNFSCYGSTKRIANWADEFSTDPFREMLAIICKYGSLKKFELLKMHPPPVVEWHNKYNYYSNISDLYVVWHSITVFL